MCEMRACLRWLSGLCVQRATSSGGVAVRTPYLHVTGIEPEEDGAGRTVCVARTLGWCAVPWRAPHTTHHTPHTTHHTPHTTHHTPHTTHHTPLTTQPPSPLPAALSDHLGVCVTGRLRGTLGCAVCRSRSRCFPLRRRRSSAPWSASPACTSASQTALRPPSTATTPLVRVRCASPGAHRPCCVLRWKGGPLCTRHALLRVGSTPRGCALCSRVACGGARVRRVYVEACVDESGVPVRACVRACVCAGAQTSRRPLRACS
jgi:hypothetical protein